MLITAKITLIIGRPRETSVVFPGGSIDLENGEANALIERGFALPQQTSPVIKPVELQDAILDAIADLPPESFGKDGKPSVKAIETLLEQDITAVDRDQAWASYQQLLDDDGQ